MWTVGKTQQVSNVVELRMSVNGLVYVTRETLKQPLAIAVKERYDVAEKISNRVGAGMSVLAQGIDWIVRGDICADGVDVTVLTHCGDDDVGDAKEHGDVGDAKDDGVANGMVHGDVRADDTDKKGG